MSLTTAVSDEDDGESVMASPYKAKATGTAAASFNCTGAVRKAGFLSVKKWLLRKKHQIELARKRGWKGYWVCLKGTTLLFYPCDSREGRSVEAAPKHLIIVDGAIMQPIPEHPKRDYIFCLSTAFGDAYLFQAPCQVELENWVNSIHSACAAAFARHRGKTGTLHLLQEEIFRLEKAIESDHKLKHMADLQQSVVTDGDTRHQIQQQILQWEENLERLHCEQFRLRCYMASLQNGELPNPKSLLTHVSRPTKNTLNKLGVFTVSSFHAFICARSPSLLNNLLAGRGATKRRPPILSRSNSGSSRRSMQINSRDEPEKSYKVALPENTFATVYLREGMSVEEFLASACSRKNLNPMEHFVRVKKRRDMEDHNYFVPHRNDLIETYLHTHEVVEVCAKILYQVELQRTTLEQMWGFSVEAELIENADRQDELCCYVSRVEDKSVAMQNGVIKGDEIIVINGAIVSDLDMMYLESVLQEEQALCMMMRSSRTEPPDLVGIMRSTDDIIESLVCPPPPSDPPVISEEMISGLIVPAPGWRKEVYSPEVESSPAPSSNDPHLSAIDRSKPSSRTSSFEIENLLKSAEQVTGFCRSPQETRKSSPTGSVASSVSNVMLTPSRQLTDAEKLRKVILELVDTEKSYVKHLNNLLEYYLEPLKRETFLSNAEITALFGNIQEIVTFQRQFLNNLEEALDLEPDFHQLEHPSQFKNVLFAIGSAFLYYVNHFKLYSSFCASHSKAQKVLHPNEGNQALQEFLAARNPKQQHSSTLESFLIKPIQRILKYPLLLQQLRNLTDPNAAEHLHLVEALKGMEKVAEHINEMQRIHEEYGAIFDHLFRQHQKSCKQPIDLSPGSDLLYYGGVEWLNISDFLGKIKKGLELHAMCFVFKSAVVFLCKERLRQKKKLMGVSSKNATNEVEIIRYQVLIPVTEVQVRASSAKDMDSHFLWELIHLRSQLQRRSEKVYVLSNSTAEFRNAFLKTIRQIIRESVRNMSIPSLKSMGGSTNSMTGVGNSSGNSQTLERPKQQPQIMQGSQTLGKPKKSKINQRHSSGNIDYDNTTSGSQEADDPPVPQYSGQFRMRSKTVGDVGEQVAACRRNMGEREPEKPDPGTKSEGEDDSQQGTVKPKSSLGKTPNHLTLSTTSTLSVGSTGSQARLIQSSHPPATYHPVLMKDLGKRLSPSSDKCVVEMFEPAKGASSAAGEKRPKETDHHHHHQHHQADNAMDKHLKNLNLDSLIETDIVEYMENLREKHFESEQTGQSSDSLAPSQPGSVTPAVVASPLPTRARSPTTQTTTTTKTQTKLTTSPPQIAYSQSPTPKPDEQLGSLKSSTDSNDAPGTMGHRQQEMLSSSSGSGKSDDSCSDHAGEQPSSTGTSKERLSSSEGDGSSQPEQRYTLSASSANSSPDGTLSPKLEKTKSPKRIKSVEREKSPIRIIKIKSPRNSIDIERHVRIEKSPDRARRASSPSVAGAAGASSTTASKKPSEGGILKKKQPNGGGVVGGILKRSVSPSVVVGGSKPSESSDSTASKTDANLSSDYEQYQTATGNRCYLSLSSEYLGVEKDYPHIYQNTREEKVRRAKRSASVGSTERMRSADGYESSCGYSPNTSFDASSVEGSKKRYSISSERSTNEYRKPVTYSRSSSPLNVYSRDVSPNRCYARGLSPQASLTRGLSLSPQSSFKGISPQSSFSRNASPQRGYNSRGPSPQRSGHTSRGASPMRGAYYRGSTSPHSYGRGLSPQQSYSSRGPSPTRSGYQRGLSPQRRGSRHYSPPKEHHQRGAVSPQRFYSRVPSPTDQHYERPRGPMPIPKSHSRGSSPQRTYARLTSSRSIDSSSFLDYDQNPNLHYARIEHDRRAYQHQQQQQQQLQHQHHLQQQQYASQPHASSRARQSRARKKSSRARLYHQASFDKSPSFDHDEIHV
uniref:Still life n=1 Tax=Anopheles christyi TaxID=43041 RepID=A0A182K6X6_9DIPT